MQVAKMCYDHEKKQEKHFFKSIFNVTVLINYYTIILQKIAC